MCDRILRQGTVGDLPSIQDIFIASVEQISPIHYTPSQIKAWTSSIHNIKRWHRIVNEQYFVIAMHHLEPVGFGSLDKGNHIDMMYVHPKHVERGLGSMILDALEQNSVELG